MQQSLQDGLKKFVEGSGKKPETLHKGTVPGFDFSEKFGVSGFYFDTSAVKGWFKTKIKSIKNKTNFNPPEILSFFTSQVKVVSYLVKEELYGQYKGILTEREFEDSWHEFLASMNFSVLEEEKFQKIKRKIGYDAAHIEISQKYNFLLVSNDDGMRRKSPLALNDVELLKKIQDLS